MGISRCEFLQITPDQLKAFWRSRDKTGLQLVVYMLLLNTSRILKQQEFSFASQWYESLDLEISRRKVLSCLEALETQGLVELIQDGRRAKRVRLITKR
jgi:biotin operon repressor